MKSVGQRANPDTWTCQVETREGRLPDLKALSQAVRKVGRPFSVRGVEATIKGHLVMQSGKLVLRVSGSGEALCLVPLRQKVQWDPRSKHSYPPTGDERDAYKNLATGWKGRPSRIQVVGPLVGAEGAGLPSLEVRQFTWDW